MKYYETRIPAAEPSITDPIWPGDPFWRSKKYPRALRAQIAHEYHNAPERPKLRQLARKYQVPFGAMASWIYAYPFGKRPMPDRHYSRDGGPDQMLFRERAERAVQEYVKELQEHAAKATATWWIMGDPLPSRCALSSKGKSDVKQLITLARIPC